MEDALVKVRCDQPKPHRFFRRYSERRYGNLRQWNREANEFLAALNRGCPEIDRLASFMGFTRTTEGPAIIVEKMTDPEGNLAPTVRQEMGTLTDGDPRLVSLRQELSELMNDLERGRIIIGDFSLDNVVRAQERGGKLVVIDGIGERVLLPVTLISQLAFRASIARRRTRFQID